MFLPIRNANRSATPAAFISWIPGFLFVASVPLFLITFSVAYAINDSGLYDRGFQRYHVSSITGITTPDLVQAGAELRRYFNSRTEPLSVRTRIYGLEQELFNQREAIHMADVKRLIWGVYAVGVITGVYLLVLTAGGLAWRPQMYSARLAGYYLRGGILTLSLLLAFGFVSLVGFEAVFLTFHQISFSNDLWQLNPNTDYLLMMFPTGFWFDSTVMVAAITIIAAVIMIVVSGSYLLWRRRGQNEGVPLQPPEMQEAR